MKKKERERKVRYCTRLWLLQEIAGCTFLEARAYLRRERNETVASLAEAYSIAEDDVLAAIASAEEKAAEAEARWDLFHGHEPIYPDPDERIDWRRRPSCVDGIGRFRKQPAQTGLCAAVRLGLPHMWQYLSWQFGLLYRLQML
ncbi:MAG: hypothetical protein IKP20_03815 [Candidatus Methanomethylophilaceae archaeon]|nr:hypothetical protein [Candidatus Methanomethylophilaceae archaeon]